MKHLRIVVVTAASVGLLLFGLSLVVDSSQSGGDTVVARFDNVIGLVNHTSVLNRGVRVGEVVAIDAADNGHEALLTIQFKEDTNLALRSDVSLALRLKSIMGEMFIDLDAGTGESNYAGDIITATHRDTSIDRLLFSGGGLLRDIRGSADAMVVFSEVRTLIESSGDDIKAITANSRVLLDGFAERVGMLDTVIANLDQLTAGLDGREAVVGEALVDMNRLLLRAKAFLVANRDQIVALANTLHEVVLSADLTRLEQELAKAPEYIDRLYEALRIANAIVYHDRPAYGSIVPLAGNGAQDAYDMMRTIAATNPVLRDFLISVLSNYLGATAP